MKNLDDLESIKKMDPLDVLGSTKMFPDQCQQAWDESTKIKFPNEYKIVKNIVVCGMGGSRFTPKMIKELFWDKITLPYEIVDDYTLPAYVDGNSLVILSSFSGSTEEILSCGLEAQKRGAKIAGVCKGGKISEFLKENSYPAYIFDPKFNPCGQPRIGGGYLLMGHAGLLYSLGVLPIDSKEVVEAIQFVRECSEKFDVAISEKENPAKLLAWKLVDTHPFIITSEFLRGFANGFANQINETGKMISDYRHIPELNHHLMEGLKHPESIHENGLFVFFVSDLYSDVIKKRYKITQDVVSKQGLQTETVELTGKTKMAQLLEACALGAYTTFYLAMIYDEDPVTIPWVDYFKEQLAK